MGTPDAVEVLSRAGSLDRKEGAGVVQLSDSAAELIRTLVSDQHLPASAGLRLGTDDAKHSLVMQLESEPSPEDLVLEHDGAALFISPGAAPRLGDHTLHAQLEPRPAFFVD